MRVLVAGVGNVLMSDDGFGVEVARALTAPDGAPLPAEVEVVDIGIRGMHLAFQLLEGYQFLVLVDATRRGGTPGELYLLEHPLAAGPTVAAAMPAVVPDAHGMTPDAVLALLASLATASGLDPAAGLRRVLVIGCEPASVEDGMGLSDPVAAAVTRAARAVHHVLAELLSDPAPNAPAPNAPAPTAPVPTSAPAPTKEVSRTCASVSPARSSRS